MINHCIICYMKNDYALWWWLNGLEKLCTEKPTVNSLDYSYQ